MVAFLGCSDAREMMTVSAAGALDESFDGSESDADEAAGPCLVAVNADCWVWRVIAPSLSSCLAVCLFVCLFVCACVRCVCGPEPWLMNPPDTILLHRLTRTGLTRCQGADRGADA